MYLVGGGCARGGRSRPGLVRRAVGAAGVGFLGREFFRRRVADEHREHGCEAHDTCSSLPTGRDAPRQRDGISMRAMSHVFLLAS